MKRRHRLRGRGRFAAVRSDGAEGRHGVIRARALPNGLNVTRAGFAIVGARTAVERNRLRRRLRAGLVPLIAARPGLDVVVTLPAAHGTISNTALAQDLGEALARAGARLNVP